MRTDHTKALVSIGIILSLGCFVRLFGIETVQISTDEAFSWRIVQYRLGEMLERVTDDANPPLYYILLKGWVALFGDSLLSMRGLSALFGCLTLLGIYFFVNELECPLDGRGGTYQLQPWWTGMLAMILVAVNPFQVFFSQMARTYSLTACLGVFSTWFLLRALQKGRRRLGWWLTYAFTALALVYSHHYGWFTVAAQGIYASWSIWCALRMDSRSGLTLIGGGGLATCIIGGLFLPWLPSFLHQARSVREAFWIPPVSAGILRSLGVVFLTGFSHLNILGEIVGWATATAVFATLIWRARSERILLVLLIGLPWAAGVGVSLWGGRAILIDRYLLFAHLFYMVGLAVVIARVSVGWMRACLTGLLLLNSTFGISQLPSFVLEPDRTLESLAQHLARDYHPGQPVVVDSPGQANQVLYHLARLGVPVNLLVIRYEQSGQGHQIHAASIPREEWIAAKDLSALPNPVIWAVGTYRYAISYPANWRLRVSIPFATRDGQYWSLAQYETMSLSIDE